MIVIPVVSRDGTLTHYFEHETENFHEFQVKIGLTSSSKNRLRNVSFRIFIPPDDNHQRLRMIRSNSPYAIRYYSEGNRVLEFSVEVVPPRKLEKIHFCGELVLKPFYVGDYWGLADRDKPITNNISGRLQNPQRREILDIVDRLKLYEITDIRQIVLRCVKYLRSKVKYFRSPYRLGALFALKHGKGSCDEISDLLVAILKARNIEARSIIGYYLHSGLHEWVEVKTEKGWVPVDPTMGLIGGLGSRWLKLCAEPKPSIHPIRISGTGWGSISVEVLLDNKIVMKKRVVTPKGTKRWVV